MKSDMMRVSPKFKKLVKEFKIKNPGFSDRQATEEIEMMIRNSKDKMKIIKEIKF